MSDLISKALLSGLGLASLTKDAIQKTAKDLVDKSTISEAEGRRLVKELHRRTTHAQKAFEKKVEAAVNKAMKTLNLGMALVDDKSTKAKGKRATKTKKRRAARKTPKR